MLIDCLKQLRAFANSLHSLFSVDLYALVFRRLFPFTGGSVVYFSFFENDSLLNGMPVTLL